jgi:hypothetical protein
MPTKNKRITFQPAPATRAALDRIAATTHQPVSALVAEMMQLLDDHLENLAGVLEQAGALNAEAKAALVASADTAAEKIRPQVLLARAAMGELNRAIEDASAAAEPPSSNTGVTSPPAPANPLNTFEA